MKYICTMGPEWVNEEKIKKLYDLGMRCIRFNLSYNLDYLDDSIRIINRLNDKGYCIKTIFDIPNSEVRLNVKNSPIKLVVNNTITIGDDNVWCNEDISKYLNRDDLLIIGDGDIRLKVLDISNKKINCLVLSGGNLKNNHKVWNEKIKSNELLSNKMKTAILKAIKYKADYLAISFVNGKEVLLSVKEFTNNSFKIISKIETQEGVKNIDDIITNSDYVMIARGDLAVTNSLLSLGGLQSELSKKIKSDKLIIGTGFLESMKYKDIPSRAEVMDLYNAVYNNKAKMIMFSSEIAFNPNPVKILKTANKIIGG